MNQLVFWKYTMKKEIENWIHKQTKEYYRPIFFTGHYKEYICESKKPHELCSKNNKHFFNELHRNVYAKSKKKIPRVVVLEKGKQRIHTHMILETPEHLSSFRFTHHLIKSWLKTHGGVSPKINDIYDVKKLSGYISKETYRGLNVDIENCNRNPVS